MPFNPPAKITLMTSNAGVYKSKLSVFQLLLRGFAAGAYIATGAALATMYSTGVAKCAIQDIRNDLLNH